VQVRVNGVKVGARIVEEDREIPARAAHDGEGSDLGLLAPADHIGFDQVLPARLPSSPPFPANLTLPQ
jgi:hypothetical protein